MRALANLVAAGTPDGEPTLPLFHATVRNGGTFSPRERIATEVTPRHPQLTATSAGFVAVWDEQDAGAWSWLASRQAAQPRRVRRARS